MSRQPTASPSQPRDFGSPQAFDLWEVEEKLGHVRRILTVPHDTPVGNALSGVPRPSWSAGEDAIDRCPASSRAIWALTKASVASLSCGSLLMGWSAVAMRQELLAPGLAIAALGTIGALATRCFHAMRAKAAR